MDSLLFYSFHLIVGSIGISSSLDVLPVQNLKICEGCPSRILIIKFRDSGCSDDV